VTAQRKWLSLAKNHAALVHCLLPNRRVEIKAVGEQTGS